MATPRAEFLRLQTGIEATPGTAVAATAIMAQLNDIRYGPITTVESPPTRRGSLAVMDDATVLGRMARVNVGGYLTFEDSPTYLEMGYKVATPSADAGTPIAYTRTYEPTLTSEDTPKTRTLEVADNINAYNLPYGFLESFSFAAQIKALTTFQAQLGAQDYIAQAVTGSLVRRAVERVRGQKWKLYIDDTSGAIGTTQVTDCIVGFEFHSGPLYGAVSCLNGNDTFEKVAQLGQAPTLRVDFHDSPTVAALLVNYQAGTKKLIRLQNEGSLIHGATNTYKRIRVDMAANIMDWSQIGGTTTEQGLTIPITFAGAEDVGGTWAKLVSYAVVNKVITLPG